MTINNNENVSYLDTVHEEKNKKKTVDEVNASFEKIEHLINEDQLKQVKIFKNEILGILECENEQVKNNSQVKKAVMNEVHKLEQTYIDENHKRERVFRRAA